MADYYGTWMEDTYNCDKCGWKGTGEQCAQGEMFRDLFEIDCPSCHETLDVVLYPTIEESRANWDKVSEEDKLIVIAREQFIKEAEALCLKSPEELPEIEGDNLIFTWDEQKSESGKQQTVITCEDKVVWREPAFYEGYKRFKEVADILKQKYGYRMKDLVPTERSEFDLLGDYLSAPKFIEDVRKSLKTKYQVYVDDNFHYMDEDERYLKGEYETAEEAVNVAKKMVDSYLISHYKPGMTADALYESYTDFGEDPFIVSEDKSCRFSAWTYAEERCKEICHQKAEPESENPPTKAAEITPTETDNPADKNKEPSEDDDEFSFDNLIRFKRDTTLRWSCRKQDVICWLRLPSISGNNWTILDLWQCDVGDFVSMTNRVEDFPNGFKLHPLETKGAEARKLGSFSAEYADSIEHVEAPNLWKVKAGDRLLWVGEDRSEPKPVSGILGIVEFREDALVSRENSKGFNDLDDYISWSAGVKDEISSQPEVVARARHGLEVVNKLGPPRKFSTSRWGIG